MGVLPDDKRALLNQAQKDGVVLGLQKVTGETIDRMDIDKLLHDQQDAFNVFLISHNYQPLIIASLVQSVSLHPISQGFKVSTSAG